MSAWTSSTILAAISAAQGCMDDARLAQATELTPAQVQRAVQTLLRHQWVGRNAQGCLRLTKTGLAALADAPLRSGPRPGSRETGHRGIPAGLRQRVWNALRLGGKYTVGDLAMLVIQGGERDPESNITKYLQALARAGYVRRLPLREHADRPCSNGALRWQLISNTGPTAPVHRARRGVVYDPNLESEIVMARPLTAPSRRKWREEVVHVC